MAIRIIAYQADAGMAANVGGCVFEEYVTFEVDAPEFEAWFNSNKPGLGGRSIVGVEVIPKEPKP